MEKIEKLFRKAKCCACEKPMKNSIHINMMALNYPPAWEYPISSHVLLNTPKRAVGIFCDDCIYEDMDTKYAIEIKNNACIYHELATMTPFKIKTCDNCQKELHECHFIENNDTCIGCIDPLVGFSNIVPN